MGAAPVRLFGQNPGHETSDSALSGSNGLTSCFPLRPESKGIAARLGGRWPLLALSLECRLKSFATTDPPLTRLQGDFAPDIRNRFYKLRLHNRRRWWSQLYDTCSENRKRVWDFPIVGNTKSVTIGIPVLLGEFRWSEGNLAFSGSSPYNIRRHEPKASLRVSPASFAGTISGGESGTPCIRNAP